MADIKFLVTIDAANATATIEKLETNFKELARTADESGESGGRAESSFSRLFGTFTAGQLAARAIEGALTRIKSSLGDLLNAAIQQEDADNRLAAALRITGREAEGGTEQLEKLAGGLQQVTTYGDEAIEEAQALFLTLTRLDGQGVERATKGAIGLAAALGIGLRQAAMITAKALEGNTGALGPYGIKISETLSAEGKQEEVLRRLSELYPIAEERTKTFSGALEQFKNFMGDAKEEIGNAVIKNEDIRQSLGRLRALIQEMLPDIKDFAEHFILFLTNAGKFALEALEAWQKLRRAVGGLHSNLSELDKAWDKIIANAGGFSGLVESLTKRLQAQGAAYEQTRALAEKLWESFNEIGGRATAAAIATGNFGEKTKDAFKDITGRAWEALDRLGAFRKAGEEIGPPINRGAKEAAAGIDELAWRAMEARSELASLFFLARSIEPPPAAKAWDLSDAIGGNLGALLEFKATGTDAINTIKERFSGLQGLITKQDIRNEIFNLQSALQTLGDALPQSTIDQFGERIKQLQEQLKDRTGIDSFLEQVQQISGQIQSLIMRTDAIFSQAQRNREIAIENEYKKRLRHINETIKDEEKRQEAIQALEAEFEIRRTEAKRAAAKQQKAVALMGAVVETARAIAEALPNLILAGIVAALGAIQIATIAAQPIPLARGAVFERPTRLTEEGGKEYLVGEAGPEILLPEARLRDILRAEAPGGALTIEIPIQLEIGDARLQQTIIKTIDRAQRSGTLKLNLARTAL